MSQTTSLNAWTQYRPFGRHRSSPPPPSCAVQSLTAQALPLHRPPRHPSFGLQLSRLLHGLTWTLSPTHHHFPYACAGFSPPPPRVARFSPSVACADTQPSQIVPIFRVFQGSPYLLEYDRPLAMLGWRHSRTGFGTQAARGACIDSCRYPPGLARSDHRRRGHLVPQQPAGLRAARPAQTCRLPADLPFTLCVDIRVPHPARA